MVTPHIGSVLLLALLLATFTMASAQEKPVVTETPVFVALDSQPWVPCEGLDGCESVSLFGDPAVEGSQAMFRLTAGTPFPRHWHTSSESYIGLAGNLEFNLETGETVTLAPGDYLHYQGGLLHWGQCAEGEDCVFYVFNDLPYDIILVED